jgi:hypothetical protein
MKKAQVQASVRRIPPMQEQICSKIFHDQVDQASTNFWANTQVSGFTKNGEPIRTDKPRVKSTTGQANDIGHY